MFIKNFYSVFQINNGASLLDISKAYQRLCILNPSKIFFYTKIFKILSFPHYKIIYDSMLFQVDFRILFYLESWILNEEEEYELAQVISWLEDFREYVYDSKYFMKNESYFALLENWYNELETILFHLKNSIQTFYLN